MTLDRDRYLASLRADGEALADTAVTAGLDAPVPACPGWTAADLVQHAGGAAAFWGTVVADRVTDRDDLAYTPSAPTDASALVDWYRERHRFLVDALEQAPDDTPVWTWSSERRVGFVVRRMAHEFAMHRVDADQAAGRPGEIDAQLAVDGIDELLAHFLDPAASPAPLDGTVHLHCTDVDGEWLVRVESDVPIVTREHAKGDVAARGPASELLLALWRRRPLDALDVFGDREVLDRFTGLLDLT